MNLFFTIIASLFLCGGIGWAAHAVQNMNLSDICNEAPIRTELDANSKAGLYFTPDPVLATAIARTQERQSRREEDLANSSDASTHSLTVGLDDYITGWAERENIEADLMAIAPGIEVARNFEYAKGDNGEVFLSESDDIRAPGADFKRVNYSGDVQVDKTLNKGLTLRLDKDAVPAAAGGASGDLDRALRQYAQRLTERLYRNELRRAVGVLSGLQAPTPTVWSPDGHDCDLDLAEAVDAAGDNSGIEPNTLIMGKTAWLRRWRALRALDTEGGYSSAGLTPEGLASFLGIDRVIVLKERFNLKKGAGAKAKVLGDLVVACYVEPSPLMDDASNIKRFTTSTESGALRVHYDETHAKFVDLTVEHYSKIVAPTTLGSKVLAIATA